MEHFKHYGICGVSATYIFPQTWNVSTYRHINYNYRNVCQEDS